VLAAKSLSVEQTRCSYVVGGLRLLDRVRDVIRVKHYSIRTEESYVEWVRRFVRFCRLRHPTECGAEDVEACLTHLAREANVSASTQDQARSALLSLYKEVLGTPLPWLDDVEIAKRPARLPTVLTTSEVQQVLAHADSTGGLILRLLYGTGMRVLEALRLRVKDIDFGRREIVVREGKGGRDRVTMLPVTLIADLTIHLERVRALHQYDVREGYGHVYLPYALARKYPRAARQWAWQYVFPSRNRSIDPRSGVARRHHVDPQGIQRALRDALRRSGVSKPATPHAAAFLCHALPG
jgi:integron integrase